PGALVNIAAVLSGRVPVNLNYTAPEESVRSAVAQSGIRSVVTSRRFLEKLGAAPPARPIFIDTDDDAAKAPSRVERVRLALAARLAPIPAIERLAGSRGRAAPDAPAVILFSSGSTGEPKGVVLTHANVLSNILALEQLFDPAPKDRVVGALPLFHSFGLTA